MRAAIEHERSFGGRSAFLILIRSPNGRAMAEEYLKTFNEWEKDTPVSESEQPIPELPEGTEAALVRQMLVIDNKGQVKPTHLMESVQFRVFDKKVKDPFGENSGDGQSFFMIKLDRRRLLAGQSPTLHVIGLNDRGFGDGSSGRFVSDQFELGNTTESETTSNAHTLLIPPIRTMSCSNCHQQTQAFHLRSLSRDDLVPSPSRSPVIVEPLQNGDVQPTAVWKQMRYDWGLLLGMMEPLLEAQRK